MPGSGEQERYVDAEGKRSFAFDHVQLVRPMLHVLSASESTRLHQNTSRMSCLRKRGLSGTSIPLQLGRRLTTIRAELARSLSAYTKNHFLSGQTSVSCSQHPLLPPAPPAPAQLTPPVAAAPIEPAVVEKGEMENPVTDVVPEQVAAGDAEPMSTPAVGDISTKTEEVDQPGGLEKVDEKVEEAQEAEEGLELAEEEKDEIMAGVAEESRADQTETKADEGEEPVVEESKPEEEPIIQATSLPQAVESEQSVAEERKQERVENPVYTLEIVGNRYNPSNFW